MGNVLGTVAAGDVEEEHSLKLVLSILPEVGDLSKKLAKKFGKRDKRYSYLVNIQTSASILTAHLNEIDEDGDTKLFKQEINQVADCLENIFSNQVVKLSQLKPSKYPRLHAVQEIASTSKDLESIMEDLFDPSTLGNPAAWNRLQRNLKSFTDQLQSHGDNVDETEELGFSTTEPDEEVCNFVNRVLDAVHCNCHAKSQREIRLRIGTYKKGKSKPRPESLSVLLAREKPLLRWHELHIHDQPQRKKRPNSPNAEDRTSQLGDCHPRSSRSTPCVCRYLEIHTRPFLRLDVVLDRDVLRLSSCPPVKRTFEPESLQEEIDLKSLLSFQDKPWTQPSKWALAVILAYSLLYLYGGSRITGRWRRENILFFRNGTHIPLKPFLGTSVSQSSIEASGATITLHRHPEILELGVILLEIHLGQRLESFLEDGRDITTNNDFYLSAWEVYIKQKHQIISVEYRKAIEGCLSPATFAGTDSDIQKLRSVLFQSVVRPLEKELARTFRELLDPDDLDGEAAEKCDLALSMPSSNRRSNNSNSTQRRRDDLPVASHYNTELAGLSQPYKTQERCEISARGPRVFGEEENEDTDVCREKTVRWKDESQAGELGESASMLAFERCLDERVSPTAMLSDAKNRTEDKRLALSFPPALRKWLLSADIAGGRRMRSDWTKWLKDFKTFRQQILPDVVDPENQQRVRVTVIDTGIDGSQPYIRSMGWRSDDKNAGEPLFYDFVQPDSAHGTHDPIDEDGHGTFIAGLLLQLAPDIELSVARIGATRESIQNDAQVGKKIGRAIKHAIETWNTEIISMSFGSEDLLSEVRDAIEEALKRNIILLAAAGNSGNRRGISYPASEERVFKVFAAKASGYTAEFSPPTAEDQYSYFILGCGVVSTWPSNLREKAAIEELEVFCYGSKEGHEHSEKCDTRTVMSGTSFATPIASALVAIIYQFYDANQPLPSQVRLRNGSENRFKTPQAVRAIFTKMSRKSSHAPYNLLEPGRGRDNFFYFRPHTHPELSNVSPLNIDSDTPIQFFSKKLSEALLQDGI
ncbi:hypothetical protein CDV36_001784 [Fusarium kuroshium]|uniref:Uncharacterized protein n=1 Tax=Fusarium kuroshium TaxID=2010991 RepID=A0A3M2SLR8_9HYPO|nr:hypothetical protein CDV36_001784 [Fusarium kuroshium]